ncbi:MAG: hypothetical protein IJY30_03860, partial [Muribaculaceae bacterium]|nr:hypothetical protein [Muribaculaceae bacterium]
MIFCAVNAIAETGNETPSSSNSVEGEVSSVDTLNNQSRIRRIKVDLDNVVEFVAKDSLVMRGQNSVYMYG